VESLALETARVAGVRVVVVENGSGDDSVAVIGKAIRDNAWSFAELVVSETNRGFSGGNNFGIAHGEPAEFVLMLNSDTIVHPGCIERCLRVMREHPEAGAMSCRVLNRDGSMQNVTRRFPTPARSICAAFGLPWLAPRLFEWADGEDRGWDRTTTARNVDWIGGAFMFVRAAACGGKVRLDEDFFFYGEDVVFSHSLARRGYARRYDPQTSITHLGGASSDPTRMPSSARSVRHWKARYLVQAKCYGPMAAHWLRAVDTMTTGARLLRAWARGPDSERERLRAQLDTIARARGSE
jgi:GT2 family glycosyltransferase